jgi:hypothetical protein
MLKGQALILGIMLLTASPLAIANEDTQILGDGTTIGDLREGLVASFDRSDDALNKEDSTSVDKEERDGLSDEDCLTIEEWREKSEKDWDKDRKDWDRENWSGKDKKNWSRDDKGWERDGNREESDRDREGWDRETNRERTDVECLTKEEWGQYLERTKDSEKDWDEERGDWGDKDENHLTKEEWSALIAVFNEEDLTGEKMAEIQSSLGMEDDEFQALLEKFEERKEECDKRFEDGKSEADDDSEDSNESTEE